MKININQDMCVGCGRCTEICPTNFELSAQGKSQLKKNKISDSAKQAADECPTEAIHVEIE
ncbi:ferredoxin [Candidatus Parcubacteria bacterium]|nr:ferredoxin [Candidatus Parcubacteria bacterium]